MTQDLKLVWSRWSFVKQSLGATMAVESPILSATKDPRTLGVSVEICHSDGTSTMTIRRLFVEISMFVGRKSGLQDPDFREH